MPSSHPKRSVPWAAVVVGVLILAAYVGAYYQLDSAEWESVPPDGHPMVVRECDSELAIRLFTPLAWIEQRLIGKTVLVDRPWK